MTLGEELDAIQTEAYAEGRKDEREQWMPVLETLKQAVWLYENYGLVAAVVEGDPLAAGRWSNSARDAIKHIEGGQP